MEHVLFPGPATGQLSKPATKNQRPGQCEMRERQLPECRDYKMDIRLLMAKSCKGTFLVFYLFGFQTYYSDSCLSWNEFSLVYGVKPL